MGRKANIQLNSKALQPSTYTRFAIFAMVLLLLSHLVVDVYSFIVPPLLGVIENEYGMTPQTAALLLGIGSVFSGLSQPVFAWFSDRLNTRLFAGLGIAICAACVCSIGYAENQISVFAFYAIGMVGSGMFHPIAASTIGNLAGDRRSLAISWFFVFGMIGAFFGSLTGPRLATGETGDLTNLVLLAIPGLMVAATIYLVIRNIPHKRKSAQTERHTLGEYSWTSIIVLYLSASCRFIVHLALVYTLLRWVEGYVMLNHADWSKEEVAEAAAQQVSTFNATLIVGMAVGGLVAGSLIKKGAERLPLILIPLVFAPAVMCIGYLEPDSFAYVMCCLAGIGFASSNPVSMSLCQRLMPYHTSLASGLMLGGAYALAFLGPNIAEILISEIGLKLTFVVIGCIMSVAGLICLVLDKKLIRAS